MATMDDPAVTAFVALERTRYLVREARGELASRRATKTEDEARAVILAAIPATVRGAKLHALAAWRCNEEREAGGWAREHRHRAGGRATAYTAAPA